MNCEYHKLEGTYQDRDTNLIKINVMRGIRTEKFEFGLGLSLDQNNIVTHVFKNGQVYNSHKDLIKPGMRIIGINDDIVGWDSINTTNTLRKQNTKMYKICFAAYSPKINL
tara:strand:- start:287 stop:619 length:333 start_codon:yes stop_codon:yes gene_type:complete